MNRDGEAGGGDRQIRLPRAVGVKNKQPAPVQITAEQILRESKALQADEFKPPAVTLTDPEELAGTSDSILFLNCTIRNRLIEIHNVTLHTLYRISPLPTQTLRRPNPPHRRMELQHLDKIRSMGRISKRLPSSSFYMGASSRRRPS